MLYVFKSAELCDFLAGIKTAAQEQLRFLYAKSVDILHGCAGKRLAKVLDKAGPVNRRLAADCVQRQVGIAKMCLQIPDGRGDNAESVVRFAVVKEMGECNDFV